MIRCLGSCSCRLNKLFRLHYPALERMIEFLGLVSGIEVSFGLMHSMSPLFSCPLLLFWTEWQRFFQREWTLQMLPATFLMNLCSKYICRSWTRKFRRCFTKQSQVRVRGPDFSGGFHLPFQEVTPFNRTLCLRD